MQASEVCRGWAGSVVPEMGDIAKKEKLKKKKIEKSTKKQKRITQNKNKRRNKNVITKMEKN